jgi:hypothetical protein
LRRRQLFPEFGPDEEKDKSVAAGENGLGLIKYAILI